MLGQPFRLEPAGRPQDYRTFGIVVPQDSSHYLPASCEDVDCEHWTNGWRTAVPAGGKDESIIRGTGLPFTHTVEGGFSVFTFSPGTPCFRSRTHRVRTEHPGIFVRREGDWRGNPRGVPAKVHQRPDDWVEDLAEHSDAVKTNLERG